ncbi:MAG: putative sulfate/molybdate transporter, partial [Planctomycetota bacterium]
MTSAEEASNAAGAGVPPGATSPRLRFTLREFAGGMGDLGTFLPLSLALAIGCGFDLAVVFLLAGLMNIATGLAFGQPIPVQPMKAIAAIAVATGLSGASVMWAGVAMGVLLVAMACVPGVDRWIARVPRHLEAQHGLPPDPIRRLRALGGEDVAERFRLSKKDARRIGDLATAMGSGASPEELGYRHGARVAV